MTVGEAQTGARMVAQAPPERSSVGLVAVIVAATEGEPRALTIRVPDQAPGRGDGLPAGPLVPEHATLERGLRAWVERQTHQRLGYVEQLYTFGDRDRSGVEDAPEAHALSVAYLALVREERPAGLAEAAWQNWYRYLPYEDFRRGRPRQLDAIEPRLAAWAAEPEDRAARTRRLDRLGLTFGMNGGTWNEERVLERYELLFEAGLIPEARGNSGPARAGDPTGVPMAFDHRRVLATAIGRLRGKIKYRPVVFELMPRPSPCSSSSAPSRRCRGRSCTSRTSAGWWRSRALSRRPRRSPAARPAGPPASCASAGRCCWSAPRPACGSRRRGDRARAVPDRVATGHGSRSLF